MHVSNVTVDDMNVYHRGINYQRMVKRKLKKIQLKMKWIHGVHRFDVRKESIAILSKLVQENTLNNSKMFDTFFESFERKLWKKIQFNKDVR